MSVQATVGAKTETFWIKKIVGNGVTNKLKVNVPAREASISLLPYGIVQSKNGDLYFCAAFLHVVLKVEFNKLAGTSNVTIIAGTGSGAKGGENELATESALNSPSSVGCLRIRMANVQSTGGGDDKPYFISKIAGTGKGDLEVNVPALEAKFDSISGMVQSTNGDLYVSAGGKHVVLKFEFDKQEGTWSNVAIIAGTGSPGEGADNVLGTQSALFTPQGLSLIEDNSGEVTAILIADANNHRIRQLDMSTRQITTIGGNGNYGFSGDGPAKDAKLWFPRHVHSEKSTGDIFITDTNNKRIRRVSGGTMSTVVGKECTSSDGLGDGGPATGACLKEPFYFTTNDAGEWFIVDYGNGRIRKVYLNSTITTVAGGGTETGGALATRIQLLGPPAMDFTPSGEMVVAEDISSVIRKMDHSGFMKVIAGGGSETPSSDHPIPAKSASIQPMVIASARDGSDAIFIGDKRGFIFMVSTLTKCYGVWSDNSAVCPGYGSCIGTDQCQCNDGWTGHDCSVAYCFGIKANDKSVCSGHGICIGVDKCKCESEWMGVECSITHCFGVTSNVPDVVCSGKGECVSHNKCKCSDGFRGHKCQRPPVSE